jgi:hypothetical protein
VGLLSGLGFLIAPGVRPLPKSKVDLNEAIAIGKAVEPRILEVLPAAVLSFPRSFLHAENVPPEFRTVLVALRTGRNGPTFEGIPFKKFLDAANRPIKNKKRKILAERRIPKSFRFSPAILNILIERSQRKGIDQTAYLEMLIAKDAAKENEQT